MNARLRERLRKLDEQRRRFASRHITCCDEKVAWRGSITRIPIVKAQEELETDRATSSNPGSAPTRQRVMIEELNIREAFLMNNANKLKFYSSLLLFGSLRLANKELI